MLTGGMPKTILIVEDNPDSRDMLVILLKLEGFLPLIAEDGQDAINKTKQVLPDLILTDLHMPKVTGFEMIKELRRFPKLSDIPVVVLSADGDKSAEARRAGVSYYMTKPISFDRLVRTLKKLLNLA
jgi:CheY-like chemotaxis protein